MTVIMLPTFSLGGITFNSVDANGVEWIADEYEGWDEAPGPRLGMNEKVAADGTYDSDAYLESRLVIVTGRIYSPTRSAMDAALRQLAGLSGERGRFEMTVTEPDWTLTSEVRVARKAQIKRITTCAVGFQFAVIAPDPRKYATTESEVTTSMGVPPGGGVMWDGPAGSTGLVWNNSAGESGVIWQTDSGIPGIITITNAGTADAPLSFTFSGATNLPDPGVRNVQTGQRIVYDGSITTGQVLTISSSTEGGSVLLDGTNMGPALSQADWFSVPKESSIDIEFTSSGYDPAATMAVRWRDTYI